MKHKYQQKDQMHARTGPLNVSDFVYGYYTYRDMDGCLDAPNYIPTGHTVENDLTRFDLGVAVIGGIYHR